MIVNPIMAMHMADALLSVRTALIMLAVSAGLLLFASRKTSGNFDNFNVPLAGVMGAFVFAAQMINFAIPMTGSSGHIAGGILLAAMLGAYPAFVVLSCVLIVQAFFFADGGVLALGCNIFNMAFLSCLVAYPLVFLPIARRFESRAGLTVAAVAACVVSLQLGAFAVVLETLCSDITELPFATFTAFMLPIHLPIGLVEGVATAAVLALLKDARPSLFAGGAKTDFIPARKVSFGFFLIAALLAGAGFSQIASEKPDGLEWSIAETSDSEIRTDSPAHSLGKGVAEKTAILPDYSFADGESAAGTSVAGVVGGGLTALALLAFSRIIKTARRNERAG